MPRAKLEDFVGILILAEQLLDSLTKAPLISRGDFFLLEGEFRHFGLLVN